MSEIKGMLVRPAAGPALTANNEPNASDAKRAELRWAFEQAHASSRIEGHIPTPEFLVDCEAVIAGTMTAEQALDASRTRALEADRAAAEIGGTHGA